MGSILITGGAGFIGSCLVRRLLADTQRRLIILDKLTYAAVEQTLAKIVTQPRVTFCPGDIGDGLLVERLLRENDVTAVVNLAAESHVDRSIDSPRPFVTTNVVGTCELLEATYRYWRQLSDARRESFRLLHVSTDEVFGALGSDGQFRETTAYAPNSPYAASKAAADHFVRAYQHTYGLPTLVTNSSNNFGPYQFPEKLIPLMILNAVEGRPLPVYGDGRQVRDWLYVDDHCRGLWRALEQGRPGQTYLFGGNSERTNLEVVQLICDTVDRLRPNLPHAPCRNLITFVADRPGHDFRYSVDSTKAREELNWQPHADFAGRLEETVIWYLHHAAWVAAANRKCQRQRLGLNLDHQPESKTI